MIRETHEKKHGNITNDRNAAESPSNIALDVDTNPVSPSPSHICADGASLTQEEAVDKSEEPESEEAERKEQRFSLQTSASRLASDLEQISVAFKQGLQPVAGEIPCEPDGLEPTWRERSSARRMSDADPGQPESGASGVLHHSEY